MVMKRCPECKRFGVEHDPNSGRERCVWRDCLWTNTDNIDLERHNYGEANFTKFRDSISEYRRKAIA